MHYIYRRYFNLTADTIHLGLRAGILSALFSLLFVLSKTQSLNLIVSVMGVLIAAVIEVLMINCPLEQRIKLGFFISFATALALTLGSMLALHLGWVSLGLIVCGCLVGLTDSSNLLASITTFFMADLFIIGFGTPALVGGALIYGCYFLLGSLLLVATTYLNKQFYFKLTQVNPPDQQDKVSIFSFSINNIIFAISLAGALLISNILAYVFHLAQPYWVAMTALLILKIDRELSWERISHRFFGTLWGSLLAIIMVSLISQKLVLAILMFPVMFLMIIALAKHYGAYVFFLTAMVSILFNLISQEGLLVTKFRLIDTLIGVVIVSIIIAISKWIDRLLKQQFN